MIEKINNVNDVKKLNLTELKKLSSEMQEFIIDNVSNTGGHFASNLGVIDLTIALVYTFNFDYDKIIFDVGHQTYPYKILTGRKSLFNTLRKYKGLSGFPKRSESKYDFFDTGHSSNSISAALGLALARDLKHEKFKVITLIGDGAMTGGEAFEGLNNLGYLKTDMLVILNDNGESISKSVGGLSQKLNKIRINTTYINIKKDIKNKYKDKTVFVLKKIKNNLKRVILPNKLFDNLGLKYIGPIDGHNLKELIDTLKKVKALNEPVLLHVITKKGYGYLPAMETPNLYHGVSKFDKSSKIIKKSNDYSSFFGNSLCDLAKKDPKIIAITAAMKDGTGLNTFAAEFKERFFDVGIAEPHAVSMAAGLALGGFKPIVAIYSTFLERAYDQMLIDVCMQELPVIFAIDRSGLVGADGETHQGIFDNSYLLHMPNIEVLAPKCVEELYYLLRYALTRKKPIAIKYPRGKNEYDFKPLKEITYGKWEIIKKGKKGAIISYGRMLNIIMPLAIELDLEIINATFLKPLDYKLLDKIINQGLKIITIEDNVKIGGFGSYINLYLNEMKYKYDLKIIGYNDIFIKQGSIDELLEQNNMSLDKLRETIKEFLNI